MRPISLSDYLFKALEVGDSYSFDCGDHDLSNFFHFVFLTEKDANRPTRAMRYDLKPYCDELAAASYANR